MGQRRNFWGLGRKKPSLKKLGKVDVATLVKHFSILEKNKKLDLVIQRLEELFSNVEDCKKLKKEDLSELKQFLLNLNVKEKDKTKINEILNHLP